MRGFGVGLGESGILPSGLLPAAEGEDDVLAEARGLLVALELGKWGRGRKGEGRVGVETVLHQEEPLPSVRALLTHSWYLKSLKGSDQLQVM